MPRHACHQTIPRHEIRSISRLKTNFSELSKPVAPLSSAGTTCHTALANVTLRYFRTSTPQTLRNTVTLKSPCPLHTLLEVNIFILAPLRIAAPRLSPNNPKTRKSINLATKNEFQRTFKTSCSTFIRGNNLPHRTCERNPSIFQNVDPHRPFATLSRSNRLAPCTRCLKSTSSYSRLFALPRHACHQTIPRYEIRSISRRKRNFRELSKPVAPLSSAGTTCHTALANVTLRYFRTSTPQTLRNTVTLKSPCPLHTLLEVNIFILAPLRIAAPRLSPNNPKIRNSINLATKNEFQRTFKTSCSTFIRGNNLPHRTCERNPSIFQNVDPHRPFATLSRSNRLAPCTRCLKSTSSYSRLFALPRHACHQTIPRYEIRSISRLKTNFSELSKPVAPLSSAGTTCHTALANVTLRYFRTSTPTDPSQHCHAQIALPFATDHQKTTDARTESMRCGFGRQS